MQVDEKVAVSPSRPLIGCAVRSPAITPFYDEDGITLYNADCAQILPFLEPCDLLLTDPPYGIKADVEQNARANKKYGKASTFSTEYIISDWDKKPPAEWLFGLMCEQTKYQIIFGGNFFHLPPSKCWLVWDKETGDNKYADCELAWTNLSNTIRKFRWRWNGMLQENMQNKETRFHPTQKPLALMKWCIGLVPEAKTILDPFAGSGTTLRAAKDLGLQAVGIERDERYCQIAVERLRQRTLGLT